MTPHSRTPAVQGGGRSITQVPGGGSATTIVHAGSDSGLAGWADRIRPHLTQTFESILAAGRELIAAKEALPHGQFGPLLVELGLSPSWAAKFMRIAANPVLSNVSPGTTLPASISTLDELTRWEPDELVEAIDSGEVTPATTRAEAQAGRKSTSTDTLPGYARSEYPASLAEARERLLHPDGLGQWIAAMFTDQQIDELTSMFANRLAIGTAARWLVRTGRLRMPPDWWEPAAPDDALAAANRLTEWKLRAEYEAGDFLNWAEEVGIEIKGGRFVLPERLLAEDRTDDEHATVGRLVCWWFTNTEVADLRSPEAVAS